MPFYTKGDVRIRYERKPGPASRCWSPPAGGLNSRVSNWRPRCSTPGGLQGRVPLHHDGPAPGSASRGPIPAHDPWGASGGPTRADGPPRHVLLHGLLHRLAALKLMQRPDGGRRALSGGDRPETRTSCTTRPSANARPDGRRRWDSDAYLHNLRQYSVSPIVCPGVAAGRYARAPVPGGPGYRGAGAEGRSDGLSLESARRPARQDGQPGARLSPGASTCDLHPLRRAVRRQLLPALDAMHGYAAPSATRRVSTHWVAVWG